MRAHVRPTRASAPACACNRRRLARVHAGSRRRAPPGVLGIEGVGHCGRLTEVQDRWPEWQERGLSGTWCFQIELWCKRARLGENPAGAGHLHALIHAPRQGTHNLYARTTTVHEFRASPKQPARTPSLAALTQAPSRRRALRCAWPGGRPAGVSQMGEASSHPAEMESWRPGGVSQSPDALFQGILTR